MCIQPRDLNSRYASLAAVALVVVGSLLAGCGSGSDHKAGGDGAAGEEAQQRQAEALAKIPEADRTAFFQLATAIGTVRARAAPVVVGSSDHLSGAAPLVAARTQVAGLHPADPDLVRLRDRLVPVLKSFSRASASGPAARRAARQAFSSADRIEAGLRIYARRTPAIGGAIPD